MNKKVVKHNVCPISVVAGLLSDTWTMLIIHNVLAVKKPLRFCELERMLDGISTRTLTLKLKALVKNNIVAKSDEGYTLTKIGLQLKPIIKAMEQFGKKL